MTSPVFFTYDELPSTHAHAISLLSKTKPQEATVIMADHQTAGQGRYDRIWSSEPKTNLLLSCILYPTHLKAHVAFYLNIISTLATTALLKDLGLPSIKIKWPNDVLVLHSKIAGTLIQNQFSGTTISSSIISIGLNVNQLEWLDLPLATSIRQHTNEKHVILDIGHLWISYLMTNYEISKTADGMVDLKQEWMKQLVGFGHESTFEHIDTGRFQATLIDILNDGQLVLETDGISKAYHMDEMRQVISPDINL